MGQVNFENAFERFASRLCQHRRHIKVLAECETRAEGWVVGELLSVLRELYPEKLELRLYAEATVKIADDYRAVDVALINENEVAIIEAKVLCAGHGELRNRPLSSYSGELERDFAKLRDSAAVWPAGTKKIIAKRQSGYEIPPANRWFVCVIYSSNEIEGWDEFRKRINEGFGEPKIFIDERYLKLLAARPRDNSSHTRQ